MREYPHEYADYFFLTRPHFKGISGLWPLRAGKSIAKKNYHVGPKFIDCYSFHFVTEGEVAFVYNGKEVAFRTGEMFCLFPDVVYEYFTLSSDKQLKMIWIAFSKSQIQEVIHALQFSPKKSYLQLNDPYRLFKILDNIISVLTAYDDKKLEQTLQLQQLVYQLIHSILNNRSDQANIHTSDWLQQGKDYIDRHFTEGITIEDIASTIGVHRSYFSKRFSDMYGIAPIQYLQDLRIEKGKKMLSSTNHTVTEIALSLGYPTLYAFTRAFTKYCNIPPSQYRSRFMTKREA